MNKQYYLIKTYRVCVQYARQPVQIIGEFHSLEAAMKAREFQWNVSKKKAVRGANCWIETI
jgi:hypothetical protein